MILSDFILQFAAECEIYLDYMWFVNKFDKSNRSVQNNIAIFELCTFSLLKKQTYTITVLRSMVMCEWRKAIPTSMSSVFHYVGRKAKATDDGPLFNLC